MSLFSVFEDQRIHRIGHIDDALKALRPQVLTRASELLMRDVTVCSLHGKIGGKNNDYADCVNNRFSNFQDFYSAWLREFNNRCEERKAKPGIGDSLSELLSLFSDKDIRDYTKLFLERNFLKNYVARVRNKPEEPLREIWFGSELVFGLFIAPKLKEDGSIRVDKSEIRRVDYDYWTIGHILSTGLYDPDNNEFVTFKNSEAFILFYKSVLKRLSRSQHEIEIYSRYIDYLCSSEDILSEPFLIPEFRYEGKDRKCKYRVDFTVLNPYSFDFVGFELSPASSHMSVKGAKDKLQYKINEELRVSWEKEMHKRNDYLKRYGIVLITFTDSDLENPDACFQKIKSFLTKKNTMTRDVLNEEMRLNKLIGCL